MDPSMASASAYRGEQPQQQHYWGAQSHSSLHARRSTAPSYDHAMPLFPPSGNYALPFQIPSLDSSSPNFGLLHYQQTGNALVHSSAALPAALTMPHLVGYGAMAEPPHHLSSNRYDMPMPFQRSRFGAAYHMDAAGPSLRADDKADVDTLMKTIQGRKSDRKIFGEPDQGPAATSAAITRTNSTSSRGSTGSQGSSHQNKFHSHVIQDLTTRFAAIKDGDIVPDVDKDLWEYFSELYKNSNKGIKGRGKGRKIAMMPKPTSSTGNAETSAAGMRSTNDAVAQGEVSATNVEEVDSSEEESEEE
ncbi:MAG: hypothetical protein LQ340_006585 [Diploschistes diacapsis]|nr:MAG: hypothetical protein LQ340_006585 [Diploschistes diacapsis]